MIFGVSPRARVGGWVAVLSENKAISASKLKLKLSWGWAWQKILGTKDFGSQKLFCFPVWQKKYFHNNLSQKNLGPD